MLDHGIKENAEVGLHDCRTNRIRQEEQSLIFFFPDGFYFIKDSDWCESFDAEMRCHLPDRCDDNFSVWIYRKNLFGQTVREDWSDRFVSAVNRGELEFEFVYTYRAYQKLFVKGYVWRKRKPWWRECELELRTDELTYRWKEREACR